MFCFLLSRIRTFFVLLSSSVIVTASIFSTSSWSMEDDFDPMKKSITTVKIEFLQEVSNKIKKIHDEDQERKTLERGPMFHGLTEDEHDVVDLFSSISTGIGTVYELHNGQFCERPDCTFGLCLPEEFFKFNLSMPLVTTCHGLAEKLNIEKSPNMVYNAYATGRGNSLGWLRTKDESLIPNEDELADYRVQKRPKNVSFVKSCYRAVWTGLSSANWQELTQNVRKVEFQIYLNIMGEDEDSLLTFLPKELKRDIICKMMN